MRRFAAGAALAALVAMAAGCGGGAERSDALRVVPAATAEQKAALWDPLVALAGEWEMLDEKGNRVPVTILSLNSMNSVVQERLFPGTPHEMLNAYHMDGGHLVMTHYCAEGNQPRMRATSNVGGVIAFEFDGISNLLAADGSYMGTLKLTIQDKDHFVQEWQSFKGGKPVAGGVVVLKCERREGQ